MSQRSRPLRAVSTVALCHSRGLRPDGIYFRITRWVAPLAKGRRWWLSTRGPHCLTLSDVLLLAIVWSGVTEQGGAVEVILPCIAGAVDGGTVLVHWDPVAFAGIQVPR